MDEVKSADSIFEDFKAQSVSQFFKNNQSMLGYTGEIKSLTTAVHEAVTNGLDACEEAGIKPEIRIEIEKLGKRHYKVIVEDNGPGIPEDYISDVFGKMLAGSKGHRNVQSRGQQGIGISGVVMFSQVKTGNPTRIVTSTGDDILEAFLEIDVEKNKGKISELNKMDNEIDWRGTRIEFEVKEVLYNRSQYGVYEYIKNTAMSNPHAEFVLIEPDGNLVFFNRSSDVIPEPPEEIMPHPKGMETNDLVDMAKKTSRRKITSLLTNELSRVSRSKLDDIKENMGIVMYETEDDARDREISINDIPSIYLDEAEEVLNKSPEDLKWAEAETIVNAFKKIDFIAPPTDCLSPIGEERIEEGLKEVLNPDFVAATTRNPEVYRGGIPFTVEVGIAYGGSIEKGLDVARHANRVPLLFNNGSCAITDAVESIDWKRYNIKNPDTAPFVVFVDLVSTHVPYISAGKQAVAEEEEVYDEIRYGIMEVARKMKRYLAGIKRRQKRKERKRTLKMYMPEVSKALNDLTGENRSNIEENIKRLIEEEEVDE